MKRLGLILCALLVGVAISGTSASAHDWHGGWHHHGWLFGGWDHGWHHRSGDPVRVGPHCWVDTDSTRGYGFYKWCDDGRPVYRRHHRHRR